MTGALVLVARGEPPVAVRLGLAMTLLQFSIGTLNDLADVSLDRTTKPGKPIPAGLVGPGVALAVFGTCLVVGLVSTAASGPTVLAVAFIGLACGFAYDLRLKGTAWSSLPWAVGVPLLPIYAWLGAGRGVSPALALLAVIAGIAGIALALANGLADVERDTRVGLRSPVVRLGPTISWRLAAALEGLVVVAALASVAVVAAEHAGGALILVGLGVTLVVAGLALSARVAAQSRERGWELQAAGMGVLAAGWLASMVAAGVL